MVAETEYVLPRIPYLRLRVTLSALQRATLPAYKGSMLRGAFGHALRRAVCVIGPAQPCETCLLRQSCYHTKLFEPFSEEEPPALLLFGQATDLELYALLAIERMAACGLGRNRAPFRLERALCRTQDGGWKVVLDQGRMRGRGGTRPSFPATNGVEGPHAVLRFLTPTRLRVEDEHVESTDFPELVEAMLRRVMEVAHFHVHAAEIDWNVEPLVEKARDVRLVSSSLRWHDWERYNAQQRTLMNMGGFMGTVEVEGDLTPFAPLLRAAEIVHIGRGTPFGLGRVVVE